MDLAAVVKAIAEMPAGDLAAVAAALAEKGEPGAGDVHVDAPMGGKKPKAKPKKKPLPWEDDGAEKSAAIVKTDDELRVVWGWASVVEEGGVPVVDSQGDVISEGDIVKAAHRFSAVRTIKAEHRGPAIGEMVESLVLTKSLQAALGIDTDCVGWLIGARITDDAAWAKVKAGELPAFSIGGTGVRLDG